MDGIQDLVERSPQATRYDSDAVPPYERLVYYPGHHAAAPGKSQTYSVEADNAALRYYPACLRRKSRCFSRSSAALRRAVKLFVHAWNRRQLHRRAYPTYACHVMEFACSSIQPLPRAAGTGRPWPGGGRPRGVCDWTA